MKRCPWIIKTQPSLSKHAKFMGNYYVKMQNSGFCLHLREANPLHHTSFLRHRRSQPCRRKKPWMGM